MAGSLHDIARSLNVSVSLVSKVLNGKLGTTGAAVGTAAAIRRRAQEIGYKKNASAASLATGRQNTLGVYLHHHGVSGSGITESLVLGISDESRAAQQRLILTYFPTVEEFESLTAEITPALMDGMIVAGVIHPELGPKLARMQKDGVQVMTVLDEPIHPKVPNLGMDQTRVGEVATAHLIEQGCRRIAHIKVFEPRYLGYRRALQAAGIPFRAELVHTVPNYSAEASRAAVEHFASAGVQYDGLFAQSDQLAIGAMHALLAAGKRVPEDVQIIGVDNSPFCEFNIVPLSSVSQEDRQRGVAVVRHILERLAGGAPDTPTIEPIVKPRRSTRR